MPDTPTAAPSGPSVWRTTHCGQCGWEIEVNQYGDCTLCACSVAE
ncbi:hypothetical protein GCM10010250_21710 [Streptomyces althioticus]|nr:hypothetical protein GCM10010250_21710 [Streptomyces althioticus]